jgi:deoxyribonuclease-2
MRALLGTLLLAASLRACAAAQCLDEAGAAVDWWLLLKHPADSGGDGSGTQYVYATSADTSSLKPGKGKVTDADSLLGRQMEGVYSGHDANYVMYNDQTPDGQYSLKYGHSKGFFAYNATNGYWVQHSIPHFPNYQSKGYLYGSGQEKYGQHAFCMTMSPDAINEIADVMRYSNGWVYDHKTDGSLPYVEDIVNGKKISSTGTIMKDVQAAWGVVKLFGKTENFDSGMVPELIAPEVKQTMLVQSWLNGGGPLGPYCPASKFDVFDIRKVALGAGDTHETRYDHSKWAVAKSPDSHWFCGVDNNHVRSQNTRSGLAACVQHPALSGLMRGAVASADTSCQAPAPGPSPPPGPHPSPAPPGPSPPAKSCCLYHDAAGACSAGETCCSGSHKSYQSADSCSKYGGKHKCVWTGGQCVVGNSSELLVV